MIVRVATLYRQQGHWDPALFAIQSFRDRRELPKSPKAVNFLRRRVITLSVAVVDIEIWNCTACTCEFNNIRSGSSADVRSWQAFVCACMRPCSAGGRRRKEDKKNEERRKFHSVFTRFGLIRNEGGYRGRGSLPQTTSLRGSVKLPDVKGRFLTVIVIGSNVHVKLGSMIVTSAIDRALVPRSFTPVSSQGGPRHFDRRSRPMIL